MKLQTKLMLSICSIALLAVNACKKDITEPNNSTPTTTNTNNQNCKVEYDYANDTLSTRYVYNKEAKVSALYIYNRMGKITDSITYAYDNKGKQINELHYENGVVNQYFSMYYEYGNSTVVIKNGSSNSSEREISTYYLNSSGFAIKKIYELASNPADTVIYTYDSNNFLTGEQTLHSDRHVSYTIKDANIIKSVDKSDVDSSVSVYEYYIDKAVPYDIAPDIFSEKSLLGKQSKNLTKKETDTNSQLQEIYVEEFTYVIENGLITKSSYTLSGNSQPTTTTQHKYTYHCK